MTHATLTLVAPASRVPCTNHLFVEMTRRQGNVVALCNACRERIEVPSAEFDQLFAHGLAVGKPVRL